VRVNLVPGSESVFTVNWFQIIIVISFIIILLSLGINFYLTHLEVKSPENSIIEINNQLMIFRPQKNQYLRTENKIKEIELFLKKRAEQQKYFAQILEEMGFVVPERVTFVTLSYSGNTILISGKAAHTSGLTSLMNNLNRSPLVESINLHSLSQQDNVNFQLEINLKGREHNAE